MTSSSSSTMYSPSTLVWLPDPTSVWKCVSIVSYDEGSKTLIYKDPEDESRPEQTLKLKDSHPLLRNPEILIGQNDLTSLSHLHEPAVLYNLQYRFALNTIYTYCGIVLVAINPYEDLDIYNRETIQAYRASRGNDLDPHIFAVAEQAYNKMERDSRDQSIIVSGESGAGKTVSAKYAMRYFATVGGNTNETQIEQKVLASSPLMEAIGNAKTTRNDNSSRFGKYVELLFTRKYSIHGASMRTYLLEKSRLVQQSAGERNYHIFYQMCSSRSKHNEMSELELGDASTFYYTNQGKVENNGNGNDDISETVNALTLLGFGLDNRRQFFKVLAALLQLGNVSFTQVDDSAAVKDPKALNNFIKLLELDPETVKKSLTTKVLKSGNELITKKLTVNEASYSKDALAKLIYSEVFNWIVAGVNDTLQMEGDKLFRFIGVLDIYGFETFEVNSFEQFCINYANEKLQQQFNLHVFKLEQDEYIREGIEWTMIEFCDNQPCIDLIESKLGILDLLDEQCRLGSGSDANWLIKLHEKCSGQKHYVKPKIGSDQSFLIKHFADEVRYDCRGFIEKNRDRVEVELVEAVFKNHFLSNILATYVQTTKTTKRPTVGSSFRDSLTLLMGSLNKTTPHYVRCIKPNDKKKAFDFDPHRAVQQLRACGVLETIRISSAGFPSRWTYAEFYARYHMLDRDYNKKKTIDVMKASGALVTRLIENQDQYRLGKTKIFFRSGQVAYLEKLRLDRLRWAGLKVQKTIRMWGKRNVFLKTIKSTALIQRYGRGLLARRLAQNLRETRAATVIQSYVRMWIARTSYKRQLSTIHKLQAYAKGYLIRSWAKNQKDIKSVVTIQSYFRGILARRRNTNQRRKIVLAQSCIRRYLAKKRLKSMKIEARSLEHVKTLNKGLENKIISLQQRIQDLTKERSEYKHLKEDNDKLKNDVLHLKATDKENKNLKTKVDQLAFEIGEIRNLLDSEKKEKLTLLHEKEKLEHVLAKKEKEHENTLELVNDLRLKILELEQKLNEADVIFQKNAELEQEIEYERNKKPVVVPQPVPRTTIIKQDSEKKMLRLQELEQDNVKLKEDVFRLANSANVSDEVMSQLKALREEKDRWEDERRGLREALVVGGDKDGLVERLRVDLKRERELNSLLQEKLSRVEDIHNVSDISTEPEASSLNLHHVVVQRRKNVTYNGMLEYRQEDLEKVLRLLVQDLSPSVAVSSTPIKSLPSYLIFMMIRYTDHLNDDERVRVLLTRTITAIKKLLRKHPENRELLIMWTCILCRFFHNMKQYSGDTRYSKGNTPRQNDQCLKNFDLFEYWNVLKDHAVWAFMLLVRNVEDNIQALIVPAILESEVNHPSAKRDELTNALEQLYNSLEQFGMDRQVVRCIFQQTFYFICAGSMNNLFLRRDLCHWSKGMDIRYNVNVLEEWCQKKPHLKDFANIVTAPMAPLLQSCRIFQMRKTDSDIDSICENSDKLTIPQVSKLLTFYSCKDGLDSDRVPKSVIDGVTKKLKEGRGANEEKSSILMDTKFTYPVEFEFVPSSVKLEEITIPETYKLGGMLKLL